MTSVAPFHSNPDRTRAETAETYTGAASMLSSTTKRTDLQSSWNSSGSHSANISSGRTLPSVDSLPPNMVVSRSASPIKSVFVTDTSQEAVYRYTRRSAPPVRMDRTAPDPFGEFNIMPVDSENSIEMVYQKFGKKHMSGPATIQVDSREPNGLSTVGSNILNGNQYSRLLRLRSEAATLDGTATPVIPSGSTQHNGSLESHQVFSPDSQASLLNSSSGSFQTKITVKSQDSGMALTAKRLKIRRKLFSTRLKLADWMFILSLFGVILTVLDTELCANEFYKESSTGSLIVRLTILMSTVALVISVMWYQITELRLVMCDSGTSWDVALRLNRVAQGIIELLICSICPWPVNLEVQWYVVPFEPKCVEFTNNSIALDNTGSKPLDQTTIPLRVLMTFPMFLRFYLVGRCMVIHSRQFQDAGTRSIASLNRINVDFRFVLKTQMREHPLRLLISVTIIMWIVNSYLITQCERYALAGAIKEVGYINALWLTVITSMTVGYGDVTPNTYCGRVFAVITGIMGFGISSALIAIVTQKFELSVAEKHVNAFVADTKVAIQRKTVAAQVLQNVWFVYKYGKLEKHHRFKAKVHLYQRKLLQAIEGFRNVRWEQRRLTDKSNSLVEVPKLLHRLNETVANLQQNQTFLADQIHQLTNAIESLTNMSNYYQSHIDSCVQTARDHDRYDTMSTTTMQ